jgi:hypothetical protein
MKLQIVNLLKAFRLLRRASHPAPVAPPRWANLAPPSDLTRPSPRPPSPRRIRRAVPIIVVNVVTIVALLIVG